MKLNEKSMVHFATSDSPADYTGYLNKRGEQNTAYKKRWFVLKGNLLFYFEDRESKEPVGVIVLEGYTVELCQSSEEYAFAITFNGAGSRTYILAAESPDEMESWVKALSRASFDYMRLVVKELEMQLEFMQRGSSRKKLSRSRAKLRTVGRTKLDNSSACSYNGFYHPEIRNMTQHTTQNNQNCQYNHVIPPPLPPRRRGARWADAVPTTSSVKSLESPVCPGTACFSKLHEWYGREIQEIRTIWQNEKRQND
uniref:Sesquipedalian n=1 Tax=Leptobrachium leishanense TaxID=445787 RepID=A0A8C5QJA1_9ANUR